MSPRCLATSGICVELMIADANLRSADSTELVAQHRETTRHAVGYELDGSRGLQLNQRALRPSRTVGITSSTRIHDLVHDRCMDNASSLLLRDLQGSPVSLGDLRGHPVILSFLRYIG